jgi:signal transduction histidine kinase
LKKVLFIIIYCIFLFSCRQKPENKTASINDQNIDSLLAKSQDYKMETNKKLVYASQLAAILEKKPNDSITRHYYFELSDSYYNLGENEKYKYFSLEVYKMAEASNDTLSIAKGLYYIGDYHFGNFSNDSAYYYYSRAEKTYELFAKKEDISRLKFNKAKILFYEKDFLGCEIAIINVLKMATQSKNTRLIYECYIALGNALDGLNDYDKALEYYNKAFAITSELQKDSQYEILKAQAYNYTGIVYQKQKNYTKAISYFTKALNFDDFKIKMPFLYANLINNLGYSKFKLNDNSSIQLFKEAFQIRQKIDNTPGIVSSKVNLSEYYLAQQDTATAIKYSSEALQKAHENKIYEDELKSLAMLSKIDRKKSLQYNNRFIKLTDSLQNNERATRNKFARIEFETDEILKQKNTIETEKNEISYQRWLILAFSLFVIGVIGLSYFTRLQIAKNKELQFEQDKQKANEEIYRLMLDQQTKINEGRQVEKKRISQELHDGVMSRLTSTRLNLFILSKKTDQDTINKCLEHIANIQNIEKEIRAISHDLAQDIFATKDSFKTMLESFFEQQNEITNTHFELEINQAINWDSIESNIKMNLYRIVQESVQNVNKYAKAKKVIAVVNLYNNAIHVDITDDGIGFDTSKTKEGIGLKNMNSRMAAIGGTIEIESAKGKGTHINLVIPV